ncbi:MAG: FAD-dependent oxidoreductase [Candidatus Cryptobacteroides sp.]|nr:FAD-dependent oxidoreductase [Bacteroides sp.]MCI7547943.1 FAD-dependent oxidoreductase [Bacteroides sp.]MCI7663719.1 FAD-dependent oxidoreductase [Bacteroides sp.]MDY5302620.1 FAD-dependent oxidoreductase [Candidatus Cryptobacteroides sp.]MDY5407594.1 FAD-dependent oxidoreductase [Candidatus Cryptobacteroides sp.]
MIEFEVSCRMGREPRLDDIRMAAAEALHLRPNAVINVIDPTKSYQPTMVNADAHCHIVHRSIDARGDVTMRYRVEAYKKDEPYEEYKLPEYQDVHNAEPVIVVGSGPAGMFAALKLLTLGLKPVVLERGKDVSGRKPDIAKLSRTGVVDPDSNYCYGEGGAGTFSDGKLFTRSSKRGDNREVLYQFVNFGADPSIIVDAHPHIGTDKLPRLVSNIRECIIEHGGEYHFQNRVSDIERAEDGVITVTAIDEKNDNKTLTYNAKAVILATGHSARDVYEMLQGKGCELQAKGFAMGVRVEHPQALINKIRYRGQWEPGFPAAEYSFVEQVDDRGVFSFCMCPGGILVPSSTEDGYTVLNGMSNSARNSKWANAGVVVSIEPDDVPEEYKKDGVFSLLNFQHDVEKKMFDYAAEHAEADENGVVNKLCAPAQRMVDFCEEQMSEDLPETSYRPGVVSAPLYELLPECVSSRLQKAFPLINNKMRGYYTEDALLLGVESRTSSPVRIVRGDDFQCPQVPGLFPCGEGAGYSGGIVSSAIDGINCAVAAAKLF